MYGHLHARGKPEQDYFAGRRARENAEEQRQDVRKKKEGGKKILAYGHDSRDVYWLRSVRHHYISCQMHILHAPTHTRTHPYSWDITQAHTHPHTHTHIHTHARTHSRHIPAAPSAWLFWIAARICVVMMSISCSMFLSATCSNARSNECSNASKINVSELLFFRDVYLA